MVGVEDIRQVGAVLADVARLGPFFTVTTDTAAPDGARPVGDVVGHPELLEPRIAHVAAVLGPDDPVVARRVAASITFQGLAALLVSAPYAAVVVHDVLPVWSPRTLYWVPSTQGVWPLWTALPREATTLPGEAHPLCREGPGDLAGALVDGQLAPLVAAVRSRWSVSERVLWGNAASAVAAAKRLVVSRWPEYAERAARVAEAVLATGPLAGATELLPARGTDRIWSVRRRSCCLYHRTRAGGLCGDCVLADRAR